MDRVRVGLIGTGFGGQVQMPGFRLVPEIEVVGICSGHREQAEATARRFDVPFATDDYRELVARDDVDLVSVVSPPHLHHPMTLAALQAGKHVLCEKPLARDAAQCREMLAAALDANLLHVVDHELRYLPFARQIHKLVREGFIGELRFLSATVHTGYGLDPSEPAYYHTWRAEGEKDGGFLSGVLSHFIDLIRFWFGEISDVNGCTETLVRRKPILAMDHRSGTPLGIDSPTRGEGIVETDDTALFTGRTQGGGVFSVTGSWSLHHGSGVRVEIYGDEGTLLIPSLGELRGARRGGEVESIAPDPAFAPPKGAQGLAGPFAFLAAELVKTLRGASHEPLYATFEDGLRVQEAIDTVRARPTG